MEQGILSQEITLKSALQSCYTSGYVDVIYYDFAERLQ